MKKMMPISPAQGELLHLLASREFLTVKEIAGMMGVTGSAVTQMVDPLVAKGLIAREHDRNDRRVVRIGLLHRAKVKLANMDDHINKHFSEMLEPLSVEELKLFRDLMRKISSNQNIK